MFCCCFIDSVQVCSMHKTIKVILMRNTQLICVHSSSPIEYGNFFSWPPDSSPPDKRWTDMSENEWMRLLTAVTYAQTHFSALCPHGLWKWGSSGNVAVHYTRAVQICGQSEFD